MSTDILNDLYLELSTEVLTISFHNILTFLLLRKSKTDSQSPTVHLEIQNCLFGTGAPQSLFSAKECLVKIEGVALDREFFTVLDIKGFISTEFTFSSFSVIGPWAFYT